MYCGGENRMYRNVIHLHLDAASQLELGTTSGKMSRRSAKSEVTPQVSKCSDCYL